MKTTMTRIFFLAAALIAFVAPAHADFVTESLAYELKASSVTIPTTTNSTIRFSECGECESRSTRLTGRTLYRVNGETVQFSKFREAMQAARQTERGIVILKNHLGSDTVVSVSVNYR